MINFSDQNRVVFFTDKFDETRNWYAKFLKLNIFSEWNHEESDSRGIIFMTGKILLEFLESKEAKINDKTYLYFEVKNIDELWKYFFESEEVEIIQPLEKQLWKHKNFSISDPNGLEIKFFEVL